MTITDKKVTKSQAELYQVRGAAFEWGDIVLVCGESSVSLMATSDYGLFNHYWSHCGGDPKAFLCKLDFQYTMKKLTGGKLYIPDPSGYQNEIKTRIIEARKEDYGISKENARTAWGEMLEILKEYREGELFFQALYEHELFYAVFGAAEHLPSSNMPDPCAVSFWSDIWIPFTESLRAELTVINVS